MNRLEFEEQVQHGVSGSVFQWSCAHFGNGSEEILMELFTGVFEAAMFNLNDPMHYFLCPGGQICARASVRCAEWYMRR